MSDEARSWANRQRTGSCSAQSVLSTLANWATPEGVIRYVGAVKIATVTCQSRRTVFRRLKELEDAGIFTRLHAEDRRKDGSAVISGKLHLDRSYIVESDEPDEEPEGGQCQSVTGGECQSVTDPSATGGTRSIMNQPDKIQIESPPPPVLGLLPGESEEEEHERLDFEFKKRLEHDFEKFKLAFPFAPEMSVYAAREEFAKLTLEERAKATRQATRYAEALRVNKRSLPVHAVNWLKRREWAEHAEVQQAQAEQLGFDKPQVFVRKGTPWFEAWDAWWRIHKGKGMPSTYSNQAKADGWWCPSQLPPKEPSPDPPDSS